MRDGAKGVDVALKSIALKETSAGMNTLGAAYVENKQYEKAIEIYKKVIENSNAYIKRYQKSLTDNGCYSGSVDGIRSKEFEKALGICVMQGKYL